MATVLKAKGHQGMCNDRAHPIRQEHIYRFDRLQIVVLLYPALVKIGFTAPIKVAHIVQGHNRAIYLAIAHSGYIRCPFPVIAGRNTAPPAHQHQKA